MRDGRKRKKEEMAGSEGGQGQLIHKERREGSAEMTEFPDRKCLEEASWQEGRLEDALPELFTEG